jgi:hypothetical protein
MRQEHRRGNLEGAADGSTSNDMKEVQVWQVPVTEWSLHACCSPPKHIQAQVQHVFTIGTQQKAA